MKSKTTLQKTLTYFIASVWLVNGLFCKVLNFVPRHQKIVEKITGEEYGSFLTKSIGVSEIFMAIWILSAYRSRLCAITQIAVVSTMNIIEFFLAPDLLLFGKLNAFFALIFIIVVYYNEFVLNKKMALQAQL